MIELVLVFFLGLLTAGLIWLLLLPLVWRRAERLTRERLERALPLDTNELLAERDRERALIAVERVGIDRQLAQMSVEVLAAKTEVGAHLAEESRLREALGEGERALGAQVAENRRLAGELARHEAEGLRLAEEYARLADTHEALLQAHGMLEERLAKALAEDEATRRALDEAQVHLESARAAEGEERARSAALRAELMSRQHELRERERNHPADTEEPQPQRAF